MTYTYSLEGMARTYSEIAPLYRRHYEEMCARMSGQGISMPAFNPRLEALYHAERIGQLLTFIARTGAGEAVGYCNVYLTNDAHNSDLIAQEDAVYVHPEHRRGVGRKIVQFGLEELKRRGAKRLHVHAATDPRVVKLWSRMGFKEAGTAMIFEL